MNANEHDGTPRPYWTARLSADTLEERATALAEYLETLGLAGPSIIRELMRSEQNWKRIAYRVQRRDTVDILLDLHERMMHEQAAADAL